MNSLVSLTQRDFGVRLGTRGPILCTNVDGLFFVLFYDHQCRFCKELFPVFNRLSETIRGCRFGAVNVKAPGNREIPRMSLQTIAPIRYVPFIIVYWNGKPYMQYDGERSYPALKEFAIKVGMTVAQRRFKKFVGNVAQQPHNVGKPIPAYTVGKPVCGDGDDVCYLEFTDAYSGRPSHHRDTRHHKNSQQAYSAMQNGTFRQGQPNYQHAGAVPPQPGRW